MNNNAKKIAEWDISATSALLTMIGDQYGLVKKWGFNCSYTSETLAELDEDCKMFLACYGKSSMTFNLLKAVKGVAFKRIGSIMFSTNIDENLMPNSERTDSDYQVLDEEYKTFYQGYWNFFTSFVNGEKGILNDTVWENCVNEIDRIVANSKLDGEFTTTMLFTVLDILQEKSNAA